MDYMGLILPHQSSTRRKWARQSSGILREEIFVTSKLWLSHYGYKIDIVSVDCNINNEK